MNQEELLRSSQEALDKEREKEKAKERKRRAAAAGVAVVASASLVVGGLFNSPSALLEDQDLLPAAVYNDNDSDDLDSSGDDGVSDEDEGSGVDEETLKGLLTVDPALWKQEVAGIREFYAKFGDKLPQVLRDELDALEQRL